MSQLRATHERVIDEVLRGKGRKIVLRAPAGSGLGVMVGDLCRRAVAGSPGRRALIIVQTRAQAAQAVAVAEEEVGGTAVAITGENFRYFLDEPETSARVFVVTANLVFRQDVHAALHEVHWTLIVTRDTTIDLDSGVGRAVLELSSKHGWLFINPGSRLSDKPFPEHDVIDWYAISRDQLGLYPERRLLVWEYERDPAELEALGRFETLIADLKGNPSAEFIRRVLVSSATSSPQAFESLLFRALRRSEDDVASVEDALDLDDESRTWRPAPEAVDALVAELETLTTDSKLATLIAHVREHVLAGQHIVVFCRQIATAAYLHEALEQEWPDRTAGRIVASTAAAERRDALERWRARGGVLIAGLGIAGDADLSIADLAIAYDPVAEQGRLERIWVVSTGPVAGLPRRLHCSSRQSAAE